MLTFLPPLADAKDFPKANILALASKPLHSAKSSSFNRDNIQQIAILSQARAGLFLIAKSIHAKKIWLPEYHCPALVEPFLAAQTNIAFYPVNEMLNADLQYLAQEMTADDAVVGIRYFGFDCAIEPLAQLCKDKGVMLIEDLAHAAFAQHLYGEVAVTSLVKFYPVKAGGELLIRANSELTGVLQQKLISLPSYSTLKFLTFWRKVKHKLFHATANQYRYFNLALCSRNIAKAELHQLQYANCQHIINKRQANYRYLVEHLAGCALGEVLFKDLPENVTPYVLPFLLYDAQGFNKIRQQGIQIYRWEEMVALESEINNKYRTNLIQLPCHQDLSQDELETIVKVMMEEHHA